MDAHPELPWLESNQTLRQISSRRCFHYTTWDLSYRYRESNPDLIVLKNFMSSPLDDSGYLAINFTFWWCTCVLQRKKDTRSVLNARFEQNQKKIKRQVCSRGKKKASNERIELSAPARQADMFPLHQSDQRNAHLERLQHQTPLRGLEPRSTD